MSVALDSQNCGACAELSGPPAGRWMGAGEFRALGLLQEVNRLFLHPMGLALSVLIAEDGSEEFGDILDRRDDPEGLVYGDAASEEFLRRARGVAAMRRAAHVRRHAALGYLEQPLGGGSSGPLPRAEKTPGPEGAAG